MYKFCINNINNGDTHLGVLYSAVLDTISQQARRCASRNSTNQNALLDQ